MVAATDPRCGQSPAACDLRHRVRRHVRADSREDGRRRMRPCLEMRAYPLLLIVALTVACASPPAATTTTSPPPSESPGTPTATPTAASTPPAHVFVVEHLLQRAPAHPAALADQRGQPASGPVGEAAQLPKHQGVGRGGRRFGQVAGVEGLGHGRGLAHRLVVVASVEAQPLRAPLARPGPRDRDRVDRCG